MKKCPYVIPGMYTHAKLIKISDKREIVGTIQSTPYKFNGAWNFAFLEDGKKVKDIISVRCDSVIVREL